MARNMDDDGPRVRPIRLRPARASQRRFGGARILDLGRPVGDPIRPVEGDVLDVSLAAMSTHNPRHPEGQGVAIHWTCCGKPLGITYLTRALDGGLDVALADRPGRSRVVRHQPPDPNGPVIRRTYDELDREVGEGVRFAQAQADKIRFQCPSCPRNPEVRGERVLKMLSDLYTAFPAGRHVSRDLRGL